MFGKWNGTRPRNYQLDDVVTCGDYGLHIGDYYYRVKKDCVVLTVERCKLTPGNYGYYEDYASRVMGKWKRY